MLKKYKDKEWLKNESLNKSGKQIAKELKVNEKTIYRWAKKFGINFKNKGNRKHFLNEDYFKSIDSAKKAYWLGFIVADGCIYEGSGNSRGNTYRLQINLSLKDINHLKEFVKDIDSNYEIKKVKVFNKDKKKYYDTCQLKVNSTKLCKDLIKLGVESRKSQREKVPKIKNSLLRHFYRGYFDGDGYVRKNELSIISGKSLLNDFIKYFNFDTHIKRNHQDNAYFVSVHKNMELEKIYNAFYKNSCTYLRRKKDSFKKALKI